MVIDKEEGIIVGGVPVGSNSYESDQCIMKADEIITNLENIVDILDAPTGFTQAKVQTAYSIVRMCYPCRMNHLLRACTPSNTRLGAEKLDKAINHFVLKSTNALNKLPATNSWDMMNVIKRLNLKISEGGCGITSCMGTRVGAYVGSIALCTYSIGIICPELVVENLEDPNMIPMFKEYMVIMEDLEKIKGLMTQDLKLDVLWGEAVPKVQRRINMVNSDIIRKELYNDLPEGDARYGLNGFDQVSVSNKAIRFQGIANADKTVSAFLYANPVIPHLQMSNEAFNISICTRLLLKITGSRKFCICGMPTDTLANHALICPANTIRNKLRNSAHAGLCKGVKAAIGECIKGTDLKMMEGEPSAKDFFETKADAVRNPKKNGSKNQHTVDRRFDAAVIDSKGELRTLVIDNTIACPLANYFKKYNEAGDAASKAQEYKVSKYKKNFHIEKKLLGDFHFFAVETNGAMAESTRKLCKLYAKISLEPVMQVSVAILKIYQRISVVMHGLRAQQVIDTIKFFSVDSELECPYVSGDLPVLKPPREPPEYCGMYYTDR
jgi:hypothetical protein